MMARDIKTMGFRLSGIMRADDAALIGASPDLLEILMEIPRAACRLAAVPGVTAAEVWLLARLAEVEATGVVPEDARDACHMKES